MTSQPVTPRLSRHARDRCGEMRVHTRDAKRVVQYPDLVRADREGHCIAVADAYPDIAVVYADENPPFIVSVLWRTEARYDRATYTPPSRLPSQGFV